MTSRRADATPPVTSAARALEVTTLLTHDIPHELIPAGLCPDGCCLTWACARCEHRGVLRVYDRGDDIDPVYSPLVIGDPDIDHRGQAVRLAYELHELGMPDDPCDIDPVTEPRSRRSVRQVLRAIATGTRDLVVTVATIAAVAMLGLPGLVLGIAIGLRIARG